MEDLDELKVALERAAAAARLRRASTELGGLRGFEKAADRQAQIAREAIMRFNRAASGRMAKKQPETAHPGSRREAGG